MKELIIIKGEEKQRLDKYIAEKVPEISRTMIKKLIEDEQIKVNNQKTKTSYFIQVGDSILINIPEPKQIDLKEQELPLEIIYEDNDIIVVNKAKGMVVHPAVRKSRWNISKCYYGTLQRKFIRNWWRITPRYCTQTR